MALLLTPDARKFLAAVKAMYEELGTPANAIQVANRLGFDSLRTGRSMDELLRKDLVRYANDVYGEWQLDPHRDMQPIMVKERGQQVLDGEL